MPWDIQKIITLLTVTVLFLFTFFNLILDAPRTVYCMCQSVCSRSSIIVSGNWSAIYVVLKKGLRISEKCQLHVCDVLQAIHHSCYIVLYRLWYVVNLGCPVESTYMSSAPPPSPPPSNKKTLPYLSLSFSCLCGGWVVRQIRRRQKTRASLTVYIQYTVQCTNCTCVHFAQAPRRFVQSFSLCLLYVCLTWSPVSERKSSYIATGV